MCKVATTTIISCRGRIDHQKRPFRPLYTKALRFIKIGFGRPARNFPHLFNACSWRTKNRYEDWSKWDSDEEIREKFSRIADGQRCCVRKTENTYAYLSCYDHKLRCIGNWDTDKVKGTIAWRVCRICVGSLYCTRPFNFVWPQPELYIKGWKRKGHRNVCVRSTVLRIFGHQPTVMVIAKGQGICARPLEEVSCWC